MQPAAWNYRNDIADLIRKYGQTPGGAPPPELVEAVVHAESGGDPHVRTERGGGRGLALIDPADDAWQWYLQSDLVDTYGTDPDTVLFNPRGNLEILALELNRRQELGIAAREAGRASALEDWFVTALAHRGYADNRGIVSGRHEPGRVVQYDATVKGYIAQQFGGPAAVLAIDEMQPGSVQTDGAGGLEIRDGNITDEITITDGIPNPVSGAKGAIRDLTRSAGQLAMRAGLYIVGALLALAGLWFVFRQRGG